MYLIFKIRWFILVWFFLVALKTQGQIYVYTPSDKLVLTIKNGNIFDKHKKLIGCVVGNNVYEYVYDFFGGSIPIFREAEFEKIYVTTEDNKIYGVYQPADIDVNYIFDYFWIYDCLYNAVDIGGPNYLTFRDEGVYLEDKKLILKIKGKYNLTELTAILYFTKKI